MLTPICFGFDYIEDEAGATSEGCFPKEATSALSCEGALGWGCLPPGPTPCCLGLETEARRSPRRGGGGGGWRGAGGGAVEAPVLKRK